MYKTEEQVASQLAATEQAECELQYSQWLALILINFGTYVSIYLHYIRMLL